MINYQTNSLFSAISKFPDIAIEKKTTQDYQYIKNNFPKLKNKFGNKRLHTQINFDTIEKYSELLKPLDDEIKRKEPVNNIAEKNEQVKEKKSIKDDESDMFASSDESISSMPYNIQLGKRDSIKIRIDSPKKELKTTMKDIQSLMHKEKFKIHNEYYMECFPDMAEEFDYSTKNGKRGGKRKKNKSYKTQYKKIQDINNK